MEEFSKALWFEAFWLNQKKSTRTFLHNLIKSNSSGQIFVLLSEGLVPRHRDQVRINAISVSCIEDVKYLVIKFRSTYIFPTAESSVHLADAGYYI